MAGRFWLSKEVQCASSMPPDPFQLPLTAIARACPILLPDDSLARATALLRETPFCVLPVVDESVLIGSISRGDVLRALERGIAFTGSVREALEPSPRTLQGHLTGAEALRLMSSSRQTEWLVVDADARVIGMVSVTDFGPKPATHARPPVVGGMATPFGIYLTTGSIRAGANDLALVATGALLFGLFLVAVLATESLGSWVKAYHLPLFWRDAFYQGLPVALFLLGLRSLPLAGTHAAEHKVVHALERSEPLEPEVVARMPRVHPRCGTNLAVGLSLLVGIAGAPWVQNFEIRLVTAAIVTLFFWKPLGNLAQFFVTTKPPNRRQTANGIAVAQALLKTYRETGYEPTSAFRRLLMSGLLQVSAGATLAFVLGRLILAQFGIAIEL